MTAPLIIGIHGQKRSGKDTVGQFLVEGVAKETSNVRSLKMSFAAPIRAFVATLMGWNSAELEDWKENEIGVFDGKTARQMMQTLGTEWGRQMVHEHIWLHAAKWRIERALREGNKPDIIIFTDVRFDNEAQMIRDMGGVILCIKRPATDSNEAEHASENGINPALVDVWHSNAGTLDELRANVIDRGLPLLRLAARERYAEQHQGDVFE